MQQHPIPQNITTYQFRLIGDMTLKQFLELISGVGGAVLVYNTNLLSPIKLTLIVLFVITGFALAFMPLEERPLDQWLLAFLKSIYNPTNFIWRKSPTPPSFFSYTPHPTEHPTDTQEVMEAIIQRKRAGLSSFLQTLPPDHLLTSLEKQEHSQLSNISELFSTADLKAPVASTPVKPATSLNISHTPTTTIHQVSDAPKAGRSKKNQGKDVPHGNIPTQAVSVEKNVKKSMNKQSGVIKVSSAPQPITDKRKKQLEHTTVAAQTSSKLPFPSTPSTPNIIVGMVLTPDNKIIENAIIEIRDETQTPVRATKTNKLGQFFSSTPLKNGTYEIEVEKEGFPFDILKLELSGDIIDPIKIQAK